jgi:hypothetical protein
MYYLLDGKEIIKTEDVMEVEAFLSDVNKRKVAHTLFDDCEVSTVFLCIDHNFLRKNEEPILFETMIFGGEHDSFQRRYFTYDEAEKSHELIVDAIKRGLDPNEVEYVD